jgi:hypothetical protein
MDTVIIAVAHSTFRAMSIGEIYGLMNDHSVFIDMRGMVDYEATSKAGI